MMIRFLFLIMVFPISVSAESSFPPGSVQARYSLYDYPVLPENLDEILRPSKRAVCDTYKVADSHAPSYQSVMRWIDEKYEGGDHRDFFFKIMLTLDCYPFQENFLDSTISGNGITHAFGNMMKIPFVVL